MAPNASRGWPLAVPFAIAVAISAPGCRFRSIRATIFPRITVTPAQLIPVVLWMTGALLSFSAMAVSIRELSRTLGILEILALRSALGLVALLAIGLARPALLRGLSIGRIKLHLMRNGVHFAAQFAWASSLM